MDELLGALLEIILRLLFELVVHIFWNGMKRVWWLLWGKTEKRQDSFEARRLYHEKRMQKVEEFKRLRYERKYRRQRPDTGKE